jgi:hypothetical protein
METTTTATTTHRISWWVYAGRERIRHTATMRGHWPGWDATCSCGWDSQTGGATRGSVRRDVWAHKNGFGS